MAAVILLVVCPLVYCGFAACCARRTRQVENDDLNRRASAMSIELVRRRSSINYDNLPSIECRRDLASCKTLASTKPRTLLAGP